MKKLLAILAILSISLGMYAEHMTFKGIPIDGSVSDFSTQLEKKGYTFSHFDEEQGYYYYDGIFAGYNNCEIALGFNQNTKQMFAVHVLFPKTSEWGTLKAQYDNLKQMLTKKYGAPSEVNEPIDDDLSEYRKLEKLKEIKESHSYHCKFTTSNGDILLYMWNYTFIFDLYYCIIRYSDKENRENFYKSAMDDL